MTNAVKPVASTSGGMFHGSDIPSGALIDTCVHCGFCLPSCPTYALWGEEMDSPRGRIYLMKAGLQGRVAMTSSTVQHFDRCLGCLACVTACPSGVQYGPLIERTRAQIERHYHRPATESLFRRLLLATLPYPRRLRIVMLPLVLLGPFMGQRGGLRPALLRIVPSRLRALLAVAPRVRWDGLFGRQRPTPARGSERLRVGLLEGCVQRLAFADVNAATVRVLAAEGCRVESPSRQGCCGALPLHSGDLDRARRLARDAIRTFEQAGIDRVVVNAAGCGSAMKEYGDLLAEDSQWADRARALAAKVRDVSELLVELGDNRAPRHPIHARVVYHDACHLAHGQGIRAQPRALLEAIPGLTLLTPAEPDMCCGSAGIYNLVQPEPAGALGARKAGHIAALSPDMIATANPGCMLQIAAAARQRGRDWPIVHPIELVDASIRGAGEAVGGRQ
jgi:glycolate oxidase iron-sulfur subunit